MKAIAATTAGKGGLVGLALSGGYLLGTIINKTIIEPMEEYFGNSIGGWLYEQFNADEIKRIEDQFKPLTGEMKKTAEETRGLRELNDRLADSLNNTQQAATLDIDALNRRAQELVKNANEQKILNDSLGDYGGNQREVTSALDELTRSVTQSGGALADVADSTKDLSDNNRSLQLGYDETTGKVNEFSGTIVRSNKSLEDAAKKTQEVIEKTEEYQIEMEKIASNERIALIEGKVSLDISEVEAGAEKAVALFESISDTFSNTGDLIGSLFGEFGEASRYDQISIQRQIDLENDRRDEALKLQRELTEAEIEQIRERTKAMERGDSLIKVDGAGLQPHLEAFMFEILRAIQIRMNADGEEMLLGLGAP